MQCLPPSGRHRMPDYPAAVLGEKFGNYLANVRLLYHYLASKKLHRTSLHMYHRRHKLLKVEILDINKITTVAVRT